MSLLTRIAAVVRGAASRRHLAAALSAGVMTVATCCSSTALAQRPAANRYFPFDQNLPPGLVGQMSAPNQRNTGCFLQPIRIELPGNAGEVAYYTGADGTSTNAPAPALAAIQVGAVYRLKLSQLPDYPGVELFPTVELLDRLHPPRGREAEFPVPISLTDEEIRFAVEGRLVTKVVYLEQPDRASTVRGPTSARTRFAHPRDNVLLAADEAGRPMAIVRLGGRTPDPHAPEPGFYGHGAPVQLIAPPAVRSEEAQP